MKKLLFLIVVLLLFPITVFAKTPNQEETIKVIKSISNVTVIDGVTIESTDVDDQNVIFTINGNAIYIPYQFSDNKFSFKGGRLLLDSNNQVFGEPFDNEYAFFLYSILENKSNIPYNANDYYNTSNIVEIVNNGFTTDYKENTNTFGFTLTKDDNFKTNNGTVAYNITYNYYMDGDYPIVSLDNDDIENPATGNYNILITIMLISVLCLGVYSYMNRGKKKA